MKIYHGSILKFDSIKPLGYDLGNLFLKPGWSVFCWKNKDYAISWAIFQLLRKIKKEEKGKNKLRINWDVRDLKTIITEEEKNIITNYYGRVTYVYSAKVPFYKLFPGNDSTQNEFTVREEINPYKVEEIILSEKILDKYVKILTRAKIEDYLVDFDNKVYINNRGILSYLMIRDYTYNLDNNIINALEIGLREGELKPGDNIDIFLKNRGLKIKKLNIINRLKMRP